MERRIVPYREYFKKYIKGDYNTQNRYEFKEDYVVGYTNRYNNEFYFDLEDYDLVKDYYWKLDSNHNVIGSTKEKQISMHKLIMGEGIYIHKDGNNRNNRKENLLPARGAHNNGKTILNGYIAIYMPEHHRSFDNGCVYEHIIVSERLLGRPLKDGECVHHIDQNRMNNVENNLMVFASNEDHISFHAGNNAVLQADGSYKVESKELYYYEYQNVDKEKQNEDSIKIYTKIRYTKDQNLCPICKQNKKDAKAKMCKQCRNEEKAKNIPSKEVLEEQIGKYTFIELGKIYGVTDNAIRRWCKKYNLPFRKRNIK